MRDSADMLASTLVDAQVFLRLGVEQPEYVPDFAMETVQALLIPHDLVTDEKRLVDLLSFKISGLSQSTTP